MKIKEGDTICVTVLPEYEECFMNCPTLVSGEVRQVDEDHVWIGRLWHRYPWIMVTLDWYHPKEQSNV